MDSTASIGGQRSLQQPTSQPAVPSDAPVDDEKKQPDQSQISNPGKEFGSVVSVSPSESGGQVEVDDDEEDEIKVARQEVMRGTKVAPVQEVPVSQELKEFGVEQGADSELEVPVVVQQAGVRVTSTDTAIPVSATGSVRLPISYAHAVQLDKRSKIKESIKWLARFIKRQWERVQFFDKHQGEKLEEL